MGAYFQLKDSSSDIKGQAPPSFHTFSGVRCKFRRCSVLASCGLKRPPKNMPQNFIISPQQYEISSSNLFNKGYYENYANFIGKGCIKRHTLFASCLHSDG